MAFHEISERWFEKYFQIALNLSEFAKEIAVH